MCFVQSKQLHSKHALCCQHRAQSVGFAAMKQVVLVITHSGFARSLQLAVGREPYKPQNAELVPVLVEYRGGKKAEAADDDEVEEESVDEFESE